MPSATTTAIHEGPDNIRSERRQRRAPGSAVKIGEWLSTIVGEPIEAFALCQNLASRYRTTLTHRTSTPTETLNPRSKRLCRDDAVQLPHITLVTIGQNSIHFLSHEQDSNPKPIGKVARHSLHTEIKRGLLRTRVTIIDPPKKRSYTIFINKLTPGGRNLLTALNTSAPSPTAPQLAQLSR